ncbi:hypothetical protein AVEN_256872-1 [Araneus ventricosus]|uniref:Uncharacterized protein n=1 Tax=Araneus ventricosus TaxID=182803 RepID=A0A4Y2CGI9_ARAVE|nr:hypothetical protein AVEN_256872-1 [Araneus ventricosus]
MLLDKSGAVDFDDLKTVIGILCETAASFALARNSIQSSARPSPRVRSPTENHEPAQDFQRGPSSPAPYMRADSLE